MISVLEAALSLNKKLVLRSLDCKRTMSSGVYSRFIKTIHINCGRITGKQVSLHRPPRVMI